MLIVAVFLVGLAAIRLSGRDLSRLNNLQLRCWPLAIIALITQIAIISLWSTGWRTAHLAINLATYAAIGVFLWANRHTPWLWVVALGVTANTTAITLNQGVMPATPTAMSAAHRTTAAGFANSTTVPHPHLQFLGDIIPTPPWLPFHNVASIGDVLIVTGALLVVAAQSKHHNHPPLPNTITGGST
jgi:hypothetical protein